MYKEIYLVDDEELINTIHAIQFRNLGLEDNIRSFTNPELALMRSMIDIRDKEHSLEKSKILPEFSLGYSNQSLIGNYNVNGTEQFFGGSQRFATIQATISIPIWRKASKARIKAAKLARQKANNDADYYQNILQGDYQRVAQDYFKFKTSIDYYENTALPQADLILSNSKKSFENGAINYVTYIQSLDTGLQIKSDFLNFLLQYNQAIIAIEFLTGAE